ncbi:vWA domain-containing protein [Marinibactrum halimedae]|uniref:VWA domain-containing protein n=1 Tax=Marinibactrum halimedae TaxID=1444977 RepID=A0AA37T5J3_9GAMM|nr:vWA domain-containing protein [Marinibactrum halimedae]MCD9458041.1 VWA domain-containing protein [Marinibactrum halimedae]GLS27668.1 hypothetical protein GCM10007877_33870 [Marinibactrum halimedae]
MARKRRFSTFSLSFLDIMSCGFGAVALIFLIIKHDVDNRVDEQNLDLQAEVNLLEEEVLDGKEKLVDIKNTVSDIDQRLREAQGLARIINKDIDAVRSKIVELNDEDQDQQIQSLKDKLKQLEIERQQIESEQEDRANNVRQFLGQGDRQYLTGLKLGGANMLILLDASSSMLDDSMINIIRRKNMSDDIKVGSQKWQKALAIVEWLVAQMPPETDYQIYAFNTQTQAALTGTESQWLNVGDKAQLEQSIANMRKIVPNSGTNLFNTFVAFQQLDPLPDNIFLITDGLPTQGRKKPKGPTITGPERVKLYREAIDEIPRGIPMNVILLPMEGDPMASAVYWQLAQATDGAFITPSRDWP